MGIDSLLMALVPNFYVNALYFLETTPMVAKV